MSFTAKRSTPEKILPPLRRFSRFSAPTPVSGAGAFAGDRARLFWGGAFLTVVPEILDWHRDLAIQALDSTSWQLTSAARMLMLGDDRQAVEAYRRAVGIIRDFASADMRVIADALGSDEGVV